MTHKDEVDDGFTGGTGSIIGLEAMWLTKGVSTGIFVERYAVEFDEFSLTIDGDRIGGSDLSVNAAFWRMGITAAVGFGL